MKHNLIKWLLSAVVLSLVLTPSLVYANEWYDDDWTFGKKITINGTLINGTLTDFPILVNITDSDLMDSASSDGTDIVFTLNNNVTKLDHEIEHYDNSLGWLVAWVKIPTLTPNVDKPIMMYYNDTGSNGHQNNTNGVWTNGYVGVWHLGDNLKDSTSNNNHGTNTGSTSINCSIYKCRSFDGINDQILIPYDASYDFDFGLGGDDMSIQSIFWIPDTPVAAVMRMVEHKDLGANEGYTYEYYDSVTGNYTDINVEDDLGNIDQQDTPIDGFITRERWTHSSFSFDNGREGGGFSNRLDFDPTLNGTFTSQFRNGAIANNNFQHTGTLSIGNGNHLAGDFEGYLDEIRISNVYREASWFNTEYNNQQTHTENEFLILGSQGTQPPSGDTILIRIADRYRNHIALTSNTDTVTDLDGAGAANVTVPITGNIVYMDDSFQVSGDGIKCLYDGRAKVTGSVYVTGDGVRGVPLMHIQLNGDDISGDNHPVASTGYLRNSGVGDNKVSLHLTTVLDCSFGDIITLIMERGSVSQTLTMIAEGTSVLLVERI